MAIFMPEITLREYLLLVISEIKEDVDGYADLIFGTLPAVGNFDIKKEFEGIFNEDVPYSIKFGINISTADLPAVHIYLPAENESFKGLGGSPSFEFDAEDEVAKEKNEFFFNAKYSVMVVDINADKVLILYHVLKYMFYRYSHMLETSNFMNLKISGNDLLAQQGLVPATIFARNINFEFQYEFTTINAIVQEVGGSLVVDEKIDMHNP